MKHVLHVHLYIGLLLLCTNVPGYTVCTKYIPLFSVYQCTLHNSKNHLEIKYKIHFFCIFLFFFKGSKVPFSFFSIFFTKFGKHSEYYNKYSPFCSMKMFHQMIDDFIYCICCYVIQCCRMGGSKKNDASDRCGRKKTIINVSLYLFHSYDIVSILRIY